jgi:nucleoid-associated protein YgaU
MPATEEELKAKYQPVLRVMEQLGVQLKNLHVKDGKLVIRGHAKTQEQSNKVWDQIKLVNPHYQQDLMAEITFDKAVDRKEQEQTYTVKAGDTLSQIAKQFYGDAAQYQRIFQANTDQLTDPNKIKPGQVLKIPPK